MSVFTTEVRYICESYAGLSESKGYSSVSDIISKSRQKIFDFSYPIFEESYRDILETKILKHYYTREIGEETVGLWKLRLDTRMNEIMPYYNQMYKSTLLSFNPLWDTDLNTASNRKIDETKVDNTKLTRNEDGTGTTHNLHDEKYWDTPQGNLTGFDNNQYMTDRRSAEDNGSYDNHLDTDSNTDFTGQLNNVNDFWEHVEGKSGGKSYSQMVLEWRETFINIDMMIIEELKDCFMGLWDSVI